MSNLRQQNLHDGDGNSIGSTSGYLHVDDFLLDVAKGLVVGHSEIHKFG